MSFLNNVVQAAKRQECREGAYVRIYGQLRPFDGSKSMVAFTVKAVTDFNEVSCLAGASRVTKRFGDREAM